jgi:predicted flap endonuclease-1-like 5' DNA nuclease
MIVEIPLAIGLLAASTLLGLAAGRLIWGQGDKRLDRLVRKQTELTSRVVALETANHFASELGDSVVNDLSDLRKQVEELTATSELVVELGKSRDDDLQLIHGIGPKIEALLVERGITTYARLASITAEEMVEITSLLPGPPNRIERQRWREQAAELAHLTSRPGVTQSSFEEISRHG